MAYMLRVYKKYDRTQAEEDGREFDSMEEAMKEYEATVLDDSKYAMVKEVIRLTPEGNEGDTIAREERDRFGLI